MRQRRILFAFFLLFFAICSFLVLRTDGLNVGGWDEGLYVFRSLYRKDLSGDWGPLYSIYIAPFNWLSHDPVKVFDYARVTLLFLVLPFGISLLMFQISRRLEVSLICGAVIPLTPFIFKMDPGIQIFNFAVWTYLLSVAFLVPKRPLLAFPLAVLVGLMPFIRQDNLIYMTCYSGFLLFHLYRHFGSRVLSMAFWIGVAGYVSLASLAFEWGVWCLGGTPYSAGRSLLAFADHYFWAKRASFPEDGALDRAARVIKYFGEPKTLTELVLNNFSTLVPYFLDRLAGFGRSFSDSMTYGVLAINSILVTDLFVRLRRRAWIFAILLPIALMKSLMISLLLAPVQNYYIELYVLFLLAGMWSVFELFRFCDREWRRVLSVCALLVVVFWNEPLFISHVDDLRSYLGHIHRKLCEQPEYSDRGFIMGATPVTVFSSFSKGHRGLFHFHSAKKRFPDRTLGQFLLESRIDLVVLDHEFRTIGADAGLREDIQKFEKEYREVGFRQIDLYHRSAKLYLREYPFHLGLIENQDL